jgi:hypothetical protein
VKSTLLNYKARNSLLLQSFHKSTKFPKWCFWNKLLPYPNAWHTFFFFFRKMETLT